MAKRFYIFFAALLVIGIASCDIDKKEKAQKLSKDITAINDSLAYFVKDWVEEFKVSVNTKDFSRLGAIRQNMENYLDRKMVYLGNTPDVGGSEELRKAELDYLGFEKQTVAKYLSVFEQFTDSTTDDEIAEAYNTSMSNVGGEEGKIENINRLQDEFADKNEFPKPINK